MGRVNRIIVDKLISPEPDRQPNRIFIYEGPEGIAIHFRNVKWLLSKEEFTEWRRVFKEAKEKLLTVPENFRIIN